MTNKISNGVELNNLTKSKIDEAVLKKVAESVLRGEKIKGKELSIAIVGAQKSRALNKKYRNKDKVANVLSFPFDSAQGKPAGNDKIPLSRVSTLVESSEVEGYLGEIVLCPSEIKKDAKKYGMMFERALAWMLIHGILHVIGYDHKFKKDAIRMEQKENRYLQNL